MMKKLFFTAVIWFFSVGGMIQKITPIEKKLATMTIAYAKECGCDISALAWNPYDQTCFASGDENGKIKIWKIEPQENKLFLSVKKMFYDSDNSIRAHLEWNIALENIIASASCVWDISKKGKESGLLLKLSCRNPIWCGGLFFVAVDNLIDEKKTFCFGCLGSKKNEKKNHNALSLSINKTNTCFDGVSKIFPLHNQEIFFDNIDYVTSNIPRNIFAIATNNGIDIHFCNLSSNKDRLIFSYKIQNIGKNFSGETTRISCPMQWLSTMQKNIIAVGFNTNQIRIFNMDTQDCEITLGGLSEGEVRSLSWHPMYHDILVSVSDNGLANLEFWTIKKDINEKDRCLLSLPGNASCAIWHPKDPTLLLVGCKNGSIKLLRVRKEDLLK